MAPTQARRGQSVSLFLSWLVLASACTDPIFTPDAGPDSSVDAATDDGQRSDLSEAGSEPPVAPDCAGAACGEDASVLGVPDSGSGDAASEPVPDAGLDEARMKWVGRYAARSTLFTFDDPLKTSAKLLSIITIRPDGDGLVMDEEMCVYDGAWSFLFTGVLHYEFENTRGSTQFKYSKDKFESALMTLQVGYGPTPAGCRPGATMMRTAAQTWLTTSTCDCPRNEDTPTSVRDCRLTDQENDRAPGATFRATIDASPIVFHTAQEERVQLLNGYRSGDRLYAERFFQDSTRVLACIDNGIPKSAASCPNGTPKNCPSKYNFVELAPILEPDLDCTQVERQEQSLFRSPIPPYPQSCPAEVAGD